jgi:hypothetical protein
MITHTNVMMETIFLEMDVLLHARLKEASHAASGILRKTMSAGKLVEMGSNLDFFGVTMGTIFQEMAVTPTVI